MDFTYNQETHGRVNENKVSGNWKFQKEKADEVAPSLL
jgi:hypothetical protein